MGPDNVNPLLDVSGLQNNGGPTQTIALRPDSPAIDAVPLADCTTTDQRGIVRPDFGESVCDIGAYEFQDTPPAPIFAGQPGTPNCVGNSVSALAKRYGGLDMAASVLGFSSVSALHDAIREFCAE